MTGDREQARRAAFAFADRIRPEVETQHCSPAERFVVLLADECRALLDELKQAEKTWKNQQAITRDEMNRADEYTDAYRRAEADLDAAKARLAKAETLAEAITEIAERGERRPYPVPGDWLARRARAALKTWGEI